MLDFIGLYTVKNNKNHLFLRIFIWLYFKYIKSFENFEREKHSSLLDYNRFDFNFIIFKIETL